MPKVVFFSDTHGLHADLNLPDGDILIHAGDLTSHGRLDELKDFHGWFHSRPHKHKILVAGNHDWCFERESEAARALMKGVTYLQDDSVSVMGIKIYGSPWQPCFFDWAFNLPRGKPLASVWAKVPGDTDILVTHSPPYGILDKVYSGRLCGCEELLKRVKLVNPMLHLFGHIHEEYGMLKEGPTTFVNGSICDVEYQLRNKAWVLEL